MRNVRLFTIAVTLCLVATVLTPGLAHGQSIWLPYTSANSITLEMYKVDWDGRIEGVSFASGALFATGRYRISDAVTFTGELPVSNFRQEEGRVGPDLGWLTTYGQTADEWQTAFGNPYLGIVVKRQDKPTITEVGVRLPVISDEDLEARIGGAISDIDRWEAWMPDLVTVRGRFGRLYSNPSGGVEGQTMIGGTLYIPTGEDSETGRNDNEFVLDLLGKVWFRESVFRFGLEATARMWLTETGLEFDERADFQFGAGVTADYGNFRPGLHMHMPIGEKGLAMSGRIADMVFGFHLTAFL